MDSRVDSFYNNGQDMTLHKKYTYIRLFSEE